GVGQERHFARVLDRLGDQTLLLHRDSGDTTGADLPALGDELAKRCDVLVVNDADPDRLRGSGGLATLPRLAAIAARLSSHGSSLLMSGCRSRRRARDRIQKLFRTGCRRRNCPECSRHQRSSRNRAWTTAPPTPAAAVPD